MVHISEQLARLCGLGTQEAEAVCLGAMLHDLGKIAIPIEILEYPGRLSGENWEIMKSHVTITRELLQGRGDETVLQIAERHHETLDGTGYPEGLNGDQLTLPQRIVAVGDIVSALSEERSYKPIFPVEKVFDILLPIAPIKIKTLRLGVPDATPQLFRGPYAVFTPSSAPPQ